MGDNELRVALRVAYPLTHTEGRLLVVLWHVGDSWIAGKDLEGRLGVGFDNVKVHVHNIRTKLGKDFILGHKAHGYTLGALGVTVVRGVLARVGDGVSA